MNKKITKILVFALAFALLLGASLAIVSSAETKPEIISKNIEYGEKFSIMYAVDASTVADGAVTLNIYAEEPTADSKVIASYTKNDPETIKVHDVDTSAYVFITNGVAAKDLGDFFYAQAIDAKGNKSDVVKYSVVEYMLERLYGGETITADQEEMYRKSLEFGEAAQELLSPDDEIQVADYKYVRVEGGTVNGVEKGIFLKGDVLTPVLNATVPKGGVLFGWKTDTDGVVTNYKTLETYTVTDSVVLSADIVVDDLGYFDILGGHTFTGFTHAYTNLEKVGTIKRNMTCAATTDPVDYTKPASAYLNIYKMEDENTVIRLGSHYDWSGGTGPRISCYIPTGDGNTYLFETDVYFGENNITGTVTDALKISFTDATGAEIAVKTVANRKAVGSTEYEMFGYTIPQKTFVNLGVEYNAANGVIKYYLNGRLVETANVAPTTEKMAAVNLATSCYGMNYVIFDNMLFTSVKAHLTESNEYYTFNDGVIPSDVIFAKKGQNATLTVADAPFLNTTEKALALNTYANDGDDQVYFTVKDTENATKFVFETKYLIDITTSSNQVYWLMDKNDRAVGYMMVTVDPDGSITVADYIKYDGVVGTGYFSNTTIKGNGKPQWIDVKFVGYEDDNSNFCLDVYVNGEYINTSRHSHWLETTVDQIEYVRYYAYKGLGATVYFDDVKAYKIAE